MSQTKNLFSFVLTPENKIELQKLAKEYHISMGKIINSLIVDFKNKSHKKPIQNDEIFDKNTKKIEIKSYFTADEYQALKALAQKEFLSVKRYIKFLISQKIYDKDIPANSEILELQEIKNQLIRLGVNMNSVAKKLNADGSINRDTVNLLENTLQNIIQDRENFKHKISAFKKINEARF